VTAVSAGCEFTVALRSDATVAAWGWNDYGQCAVPAGLNEVQGVAAGYYHALALRRDGTVRAWAAVPVPTPGGAPGRSGGQRGYNHSLALKGDGTIVQWGVGPLRRPVWTRSWRSARAMPTTSRCAPMAPSSRGASRPGRAVSWRRVKP